MTLIDAKGMSLVSLAEACEIPESEVRRKITYWTSRGVVREIPHQQSTSSVTHSSPSPTVTGTATVTGTGGREESDELDGTTYEVVNIAPNSLTSCNETTTKQFTSYGDMADSDHKVCLQQQWVCVYVCMCVVDVIDSFCIRNQVEYL
jgi:hypothetical protein